MPVQRFILALLVAVALAVPDAEAGFQGTLQDNADFEINVDNSQGGETPITVTYLNRNGTGIRTMQNFTLPAGQRIQVIGTIPKGTSRMFLEVQPQSNAEVFVEVKQGAASYLRTFLGEGRDVYDIVPTP